MEYYVTIKELKKTISEREEDLKVLKELLKEMEEM